MKLPDGANIGFMKSFDKNTLNAVGAGQMAAKALLKAMGERGGGSDADLAVAMQNLGLAASHSPADMMKNKGDMLKTLDLVQRRMNQIALAQAQSASMTQEQLMQKLQAQTTRNATPVKITGKSQ